MSGFIVEGVKEMGKWLLLALIGWVSFPLWASDVMREARMAAEIREALLVGEPVMLSSGDTEFLAIFAEETTDTSQGAAIILHGRGAHPDWMEVINPLRSQLPDYGWKTLSLQMPIAAADAPDEHYAALIPEAAPRIMAAVDYLKQQGVTNVVLIAHSLGAKMGVAYLAQGIPDELKAFVAVGLPSDRKRTDQGTLADLAKIKLPLLDLYGSRDIDAVLNSVKARAAAAKRAENGDYRQREVEGADHFFTGLDDALVAQVRAWIGRVAPGEQVRQ
ncbi:MAG: alpha/beta hydrolase family protein [Sedimenticola sp.]|nr:alpha/beta hydrolase family protein [Sedimenticola sp.]